MVKGCDGVILEIPGSNLNVDEKEKKTLNMVLLVILFIHVVHTLLTRSSSLKENRGVLYTFW